MSCVAAAPAAPARDIDPVKARRPAAAAVPMRHDAAQPPRMPAALRDVFVGASEIGKETGRPPPSRCVPGVVKQCKAVVEAPAAAPSVERPFPPEGGVRQSSGE